MSDTPIYDTLVKEQERASSAGKKSAAPRKRPAKKTATSRRT